MTSDLKADSARELPPVVGKCDTCGMGVIAIFEDSPRHCLRHNVKTGAKCPGRIIDIEPVPNHLFPPQQHWSTIGS